MTLGKDAKMMATRHELGILRKRKPATDEYAMVVHFDDFVLRGNAGNTVGYEKRSLLHRSEVGNAVRHDKRGLLHNELQVQGAPLNSDAKRRGGLAGWGVLIVVIVTFNSRIHELPALPLLSEAPWRSSFSEVIFLGY